MGHLIGPLATIIVASSVITSCGLTGDLVPPATRKPYFQAFGPTYPDAPMGAVEPGTEDVTLSADGRTITVTFIGARAYEVSDLCSVDYSAWTGLDGDTLQIAVSSIDHPEQGKKPDQECTLEGHRFTFALRLPEPFRGSTVRDVGGLTFWVAAPGGLAEPTLLPPGWHLQRGYDVPEAVPPMWVRVYAADGVDSGSGSGEGPGHLAIYEAFGGWATKGGGSEGHSFKVNGAPAVLMRDPETGELVLSFRLDGNGITLVANDIDVSIDELRSIAEAMAPPPK